MEIIETLKEKFEDSDLYLGVRFEKKNRQIGDFIPVSKGNPDRLDSREFPDFDSKEYNNLPDLIGTSAYDIDYWENYIDLEDCKEDGTRVYVIAGDDYVEGEDYDEMIIINAKVIAILA